MTSPDSETEEPDESGAQPPDETETKGRRRSFRNARRELNDEELTSPAVQKLLLDELERLEEALSDASGTQTKLHKEELKVAVFQEKIKSHNSVELISIGTIAIGSLLMGFSFDGTSNEVTWPTMICGGVLLCVGIFAKWIKL